MPIDDAHRWNQRYRNEYCESDPEPRSLLVDHSNWLPTQGLALDIAMGLGGNARFLIDHGLNVVGVDISSVAVHRAVQSEPKIMGIIADMEHFYIPPDSFDLIIDFLYLQIDLWESMINGLRIGGLMFIELLTEEMRTIHPETKPTYLLRNGELHKTFSGGAFRNRLEFLHYFEGWISTENSHPRSVASLVARRIA